MEPKLDPQQARIVALAQSLLIDCPTGIPFLYDANDTAFFYFPALRQGGFMLAGKDANIGSTTFEALCELIGQYGCDVEPQRLAEWIENISNHPDFNG